MALARALINEPTILLLDEPLSALDLKLRKQMQSELKVLQRKVGITFVYVTHDQDEALALSDRIAVMNNGKILQVGTPSEIYDSPQTRFVADFIGTSNFLDGTLISENEIVLTTESPRKVVCVPNRQRAVEHTCHYSDSSRTFRLKYKPRRQMPRIVCAAQFKTKVTSYDIAIHCANRLSDPTYCPPAEHGSKRHTPLSTR